MPLAGAQNGNTHWTDNEIDPSTWDDGPELEGSPMDIPRPGDPVLVIEVTYRPGHLFRKSMVRFTLNYFPIGHQ